MIDALLGWRVPIPVSPWLLFPGLFLFGFCLGLLVSSDSDYE